MALMFQPSLKFGLFVCSPLLPVLSVSDIAIDQEVLGYYVDGMRVPDDVTLLWADDT